MKFRKKPVVIEAFQVPPAGETCSEEMMEFLEGAETDNAGDGSILIHTLKGTMTASPGDWIIKSANGFGVCLCDPSFFEASYEPVSAAPAAASGEVERQETINGLLRLRKRLCTGPCGQSSATLQQREDDRRLITAAIMHLGYASSVGAASGDINKAIADAAIADMNEGAKAVDEAHKKFGYDSLRFADVRHGWHRSSSNLSKILLHDGESEKWSRPLSSASTQGQGGAGLHQRIMNLPSREGFYRWDDFEEAGTARGLELAYKLGHRDARHAAAELAVTQKGGV